MNTTKELFAQLVTIMDELREKCPWDKKQTIHTLRNMTIEETYELSDGVLNEDWVNIKEELGDLLLHILFYSKIATEQNKFTLDEVIETISQKLIRRHPHIYGNVQVANADEVKQNWEAIKATEKQRHHLLDSIPNSLPALPKAKQIQEKVKKVGFEWENKEDVWKKVEEEMEEFKEALTLQEKENEFGDIVFSLVNYARFIDIDPELAVEKTNKKFTARFNKLEDIAKINGKALTDMSLREMDAIWNDIKKNKA